jgi:hypothetical protein
MGEACERTANHKTLVDKLVASFAESGCSQAATGYEDINIAQCLRTVSAHTHRRRAMCVTETNPSRPDGRRERANTFLAVQSHAHDQQEDHANKVQLVLVVHVLPDQRGEYARLRAHVHAQGVDCCADEYISFHYVTPDEMRVLEFLVYYASPFTVREVWL